jgi:hypothetical protein
MDVVVMVAILLLLLMRLKPCKGIARRSTARNAFQEPQPLVTQEMVTNSTCLLEGGYWRIRD